MNTLLCSFSFLHEGTDLDYLNLELESFVGADLVALGPLAVRKIRRNPQGDFTALADKLNCNWTDEEYRARRIAICDRHPGQAIIPFGQDDDLITAKQNAAYFDLSLAQHNVEDAKRSLEFARKELDPQRLKGFMMAPWEVTDEKRREFLKHSIDIVAQSMKV